MTIFNSYVSLPEGKSSSCQSVRVMSSGCHGVRAYFPLHAAVRETLGMQSHGFM